LERPVCPAPAEIAAIRAVLQEMESGGRRARYQLSHSPGIQVDLPPVLLDVLLTAARELSSGRAITIVRSERELTTQQAADLLQVSRPHLIGLLEEGALPYHKIGSHRRIALGDLLAYKQAHTAYKFRGPKAASAAEDGAGYESRSGL
jgi:excisionase family DNA binding protein